MKIFSIMMLSLFINLPANEKDFRFDFIQISIFSGL